MTKSRQNLFVTSPPKTEVCMYAFGWWPGLFKTEVELKRPNRLTRAAQSKSVNRQNLESVKMSEFKKLERISSLHCSTKFRKTAA